MTPFLDLLEPLEDRKTAWANASNAVDGSHAEALLHEAEVAAEETRHRARLEADAIRASALADADGIREGARVEGMNAGRAAGYAEVEAELRSEWEAKLADFRAEVGELTASIGEAREILWQTQEPEMVRFVLEIARKIVKTELTQNPDIVLGVLRNAMQRVIDKELVRIRVSLRDAPRVRGVREDLISTLDGIKGLEIIEDRRVGSGGCVIETNAGTIDAKIETQLSEVDRVIEHALEG